MLNYSETGNIKDRNRLRWLWGIFFAAALIATIRNLLLPETGAYTHYNNYIIFKNSFYHWWEHLNLYSAYPGEQYDLFKYSPAFAMFMGLFAMLPDWLGLSIWNLLNASVLCFAISRITFSNSRNNLLFGILVIQEMMTSAINSQSNAMIAGLLILAWLALEKQNWWLASFFICSTVFIKLFGIVLFTMFLFYPKWRKGIIPALTVFLLFLLVPAAAGGFDTLLMQYKGYGNLLANDHGTFVKYSVMGWLDSWFNWHPDKNIILLFGALIQLLLSALILAKNNQLRTRAMLVATWLIWIVIFNHMAESATFIIAVTGVMIWFFHTTQKRFIVIPVLVAVLAFTCFGPSDIYPPAWREKIVIDWQLKVFPCILVWILTGAEMVMDTISSSKKKQPAPL